MPGNKEQGSELLGLIGEEALVLLAETFGGTRLAIPLKMSAAHGIAQAIGLEAAVLMTERFAPDVIRVPLAREFRVKRYKSQGLSNAKIAVKLGMTESGINRTVRRIAERQGVCWL